MKGKWLFLKKKVKEKYKILQILQKDFSYL